MLLPELLPDALQGEEDAAKPTVRVRKPSKRYSGQNGPCKCWKILTWGDEAYAGGSGNAPGGGSKPTICIFSKANEGFRFTVQNGGVCLAPTNPCYEF
ncbi:hypothetical protein GUJ93_ZPchr0004g38948 [Zizania palustris]|uniref:Uncharacterized protein n=1 Tax=Zizania palustris TaxID=103762 RepID=A0A8J5SKD8_ZIZPA|nr:hypothetical protein GUJ93_ZPchr0004g38948 [Zizania palustris]